MNGSGKALNASDIKLETDDKDEIEEEEENVSKEAGFGRVMTYYRPKLYAFVSLIVSMLSGTSMPFLGWFMCELQFIIILGIDYPTFIQDRDRTITFFLIYVVAIGFVGFLQKFVFAVSGENVTFQIRYELFESLIHKQVAWFDRRSKAPGILSNMLSEDINNVLGLSTTHISMCAESATTIIGGVTAAFFFNW